MNLNLHQAAKGQNQTRVFDKKWLTPHAAVARGYAKTRVANTMDNSHVLCLRNPRLICALCHLFATYSTKFLFYVHASPKLRAILGVAK